jgi:hypothetical protein
MHYIYIHDFIFNVSCSKMTLDSMGTFGDVGSIMDTKTPLETDRHIIDTVVSFMDTLDPFRKLDPL